MKKNTTVIDVTSLVAPYWRGAWVVWPPRNARDIPHRFTPELPNPVPGEDQTKWGYPITLQVYRGAVKGAPKLTMELFKGKDENSLPVRCHYLTPDAPRNQNLAPANAYCLIPKAKLARGTTYTVRAGCELANQSITWSFVTAR